MVDATTHDVMVAQTQEMRAILDYFQNFRGTVDPIINQIRESLSVRIYLNETAGNDLSLGGENTPVKTVKEAVSRVPPGAFGTIVFKDNATLTESVDTRARGLLFEAYPGLDVAFKSGWRVDPGDGLYYPGQINFAGSYGSIGFNKVGMHFESMPAGTRGDPYACGVFSTNSLTPPLFVGLFECAITRNAGATAFLIAAASNSATLNVANSVTYSAAINGYWFAGVSAGTARTTTRYNTNIASL